MRYYVHQKASDGDYFMRTIHSSESKKTADKVAKALKETNPKAEYKIVYE